MRRDRFMVGLVALPNGFMFRRVFVYPCSLEWGAVGSQDVEVSGGVFPYGEFLVVFESVVFSAHGCAVTWLCLSAC